MTSEKIIKRLLEEIMIEKLENQVAARLAKHYPQPATAFDIGALLAAPDPFYDEED
jgi:hypothetical protein